MQKPYKGVPLWGGLVSCGSIVKRSAQWLATTAQDAILPHKQRARFHGK